MPRNFPAGDSSIGSPTSRRALLSAFAAAPAAALAAPVMCPWDHALTLLHDHYEDEPAVVIRTKDGRSLSRWRYPPAEGFFPDNETGSIGGWHRFLYFSWITDPKSYVSGKIVSVSLDYGECHIIKKKK